ncbi:MAG TPA: hypothetical protein VFI65_00435, partial [Streptosporangiaceae bacterium]|nr:hypothetical protein [Streptosporangiaceae bacterium]
VPLIDIDSQVRLSHEINERLHQIGNIEIALNRQRKLLSERMQALITGAVTGQIDLALVHEIS